MIFHKALAQARLLAKDEVRSYAIEFDEAENSFKPWNAAFLLQYRIECPEPVINPVVATVEPSGRVRYTGGYEYLEELNLTEAA